MNCPSCGKEMEAGFLFYSRRGPVIWTKNPKKKTIITVSEDVLLDDLDPGRNSWPAAWICKDCRKVIVDY